MNILDVYRGNICREREACNNKGKMIPNKYHRCDSVAFRVPFYFAPFPTILTILTRGTGSQQACPLCIRSLVGLVKVCRS